MDDSDDESFDPARKCKHHDLDDESDDNDDDYDNEFDHDLSKPRSKSKNRRRSCPVTPKAAVSEPFRIYLTLIWFEMLVPCAGVFSHLIVSLLRFS